MADQASRVATPQYPANPLRPQLGAWVANVLGDMMLNAKLAMPSSRGAPPKAGRNGVIVSAIAWAMQEFRLLAERREREGPREVLRRGGIGV